MAGTIDWEAERDGSTVAAKLDRQTVYYSPEGCYCYRVWDPCDVCRTWNRNLRARLNAEAGYSTPGAVVAVLAGFVTLAAVLVPQAVEAAHKLSGALS